MQTIGKTKANKTRGRGLVISLIIGLGLSAGAVYAQTPAISTKKASPKNPLTTSQPSELGLSSQTLNFVNSFGQDHTATIGRSQAKTFRMDLQGKWGVSLDVNQVANMPAGWNDVDAGAFYKLGPRVRVGGAVGYGQKTIGFQPAAQDPNKTQPRVKFQTELKF